MRSSHFPIDCDIKQDAMRRIHVLVTAVSYFYLSPSRAQQPGALDLAFAPSPGIGSQVESIALQPDGKLLIGGWFSNWGGSGHGRVVRLDTSGALDPDFAPGSGANSIVFTTTIQPDGKVLIGGVFTTFNDTARSCIARLHPDGRLDTDFDPLSGVNGGTGSSVNAMLLQPDGRILIGGDFTGYQGTPKGKITRINADASLDTSFHPGGIALLGGQVRSMALQPDGKVLVGGDFNAFNGSPQKGIVRLLPDGTTDPSFDPGSGFAFDNGVAGVIHMIALQPDGKLIIGGAFDKYDGIPCSNIVRLNDDGSLDTGFDPGTGTDNVVWTTLLQPDGKILIGGGFTTYNGFLRRRVARLNADGSLDHGFDPGTGADNNIRTLALLPDGRILIGGDLGNYNGVPRGMVARLFGINASPITEVLPRVFLEGPYDPATGRMQDALRTMIEFPLSEPYTSLGYPHTGGGGGSISPAVLSITGDNAIVDWVLVELRYASAAATVVATRSALLQRDGDVVATDGVSPVTFDQPPGDYRIAVRHRNHLGCMTADPLPLGAAPTVVDFTAASTAAHGTDALKAVGGTHPASVLWAGDVNFDGALKYTGAGNDRDPILTTIGGVVPTNTVTGYHAGDVNMDGEVKYTGQDNDRDPILQNIGGAVPTNTRLEQLP